MSYLEVRRHWLEELHPFSIHQLDDGVAIAEMRCEDGRLPGWMRDNVVADRRAALAAFAPQLVEAVRAWVARPGGLGAVFSLPTHLEIASGRDVDLGNWQFEGVTLDDDVTAAWLGVEDVFEVRHGLSIGTLKFYTDIAQVRIPLAAAGIDSQSLTERARQRMTDPHSLLAVS